MITYYFKHKRSTHILFYLFSFILLIIYYRIFSNSQITTQKIGNINLHLSNIKIQGNITFETTIQCLGHPYNQSCLFKNLYYVDSEFMILTVNGSSLPPLSLRTDAFIFWNQVPKKRVFETYVQLEKFVRNTIYPKVIPSLTLYFGQLWHHNIGHALFDGLYPAYVGLIRFSPRHLQSFRILAGIDNCNDCWSEDVYGRFGGLGILKQRVLNAMSKNRWYMFEELVMGSGTMCQRCNQPNLQLCGGIELDATRLFRDRMYRQHGLAHPIIRRNSSAEHRTRQDIIQAFIIDNKRFTVEDRKELDAAIHEINNSTSKNLQWPLINVTYLHYNHVKAQNETIQINATAADIRPPTYELVDNNFIAQLKILHRIDIHISGPGTGQMYQPFLSDGSVNINLGGLRPWGLEKTDQAYASYLEQHMTSGTPYIKGLYYPINERVKGIKKDEVIKLIRQASQLILEGFSLPVNPQENLAADGRIFVEMCERDKIFCSSVTVRSSNNTFACLDMWVEDLVHENRQWSLNGFVDSGRNITCPFNHTLLHELRLKYGIKHNSKT